MVVWAKPSSQKQIHASKVANAWDTFAVRNPEYLQLIDWDPDIWSDANLDAVEEWLVQHLRERFVFGAPLEPLFSEMPESEKNEVK